MKFQFGFEIPFKISHANCSLLKGSNFKWNSFKFTGSSAASERFVIHSNWMRWPDAAAWHAIDSSSFFLLLFLSRCVYSRRYCVSFLFLIIPSIVCHQTIAEAIVLIILLSSFSSASSSPSTTILIVLLALCCWTLFASVHFLLPLLHCDCVNGIHLLFCFGPFKC